MKCATVGTWCADAVLKCLTKHAAGNLMTKLWKKNNNNDLNRLNQFTRYQTRWISNNQFAAQVVEIVLRIAKNQ